MAIARARRTVDVDLIGPPLRSILGVTQEDPDPPPGAAAEPAAAAKSQLELTDWAMSVGIAFAIAAAAYVVALLWLLPDCAAAADGCNTDQLYRVSSDLSVFAGLFVLALAVERLLAPFSRFIGPDTEEKKDERDKAQAAVESGTGTTQELASAQAGVDRSRQIGAIAHWGLAVAVGFLLAGQLDILLLSAIAAEGSADPAPWADLLVTGLVVGAGTKPLHDLVSRIEKSKEAAQDQKATGGNA
jgi:hypothetical protein